MWRWCNTRRAVIAAVAAVFAVALPAVGSAAAAQDNGAIDPAAQPPELEAPMVAPSHGARAHALVEQWVRRGEIPAADTADHPDTADDAAPVERIAVTGLFGVQVTLRLDGVTVGRGEAFRDDPAGALETHGPAVDAAELLRPATRRALAEVEGRLADAHRRAIERQLGDELPEAPELADVADRLLVDVQLAHRLERVEVPADAELAAVMGMFAPGFHGLHSPGAPDLGAATIWPATALAHRSTPRGQAMRLLDARGRDPEAILELGRPGGIPLVRFEVVHVVRAQPHLPPRTLVRGNEPMPPHAIDSATLDDVISRLGAHLAGRFTSGRLVRGTFNPTSNRYDPEVAETRDAGLACFALMRYAQRRADRAGGEDEHAQALARQAREAAATLGRTLLASEQVQRPAGLALALLTLVDDIAPGEYPELRDELIEAVGAMYDPESQRFLIAGDEGPEPVGEASAALLTAALAAVYEQTRDGGVGRVVRAQLEAVWQQLEGASNVNVAALPWLVEAHHRAGRLLARDDEAALERLAARERGLDRLTGRLLEHQVTRTPDFGPADVVGGFELTRGPVDAPPSPDWRTAHVLSHLAVTLREPGITDDRDARDRLLRAALAARFIAQLMMDEPSCYYVRSLPEAVGGVRLALWDNRLGVASTAMGLLACVQLQETVDLHAERFGD